MKVEVEITVSEALAALLEKIIGLLSGVKAAKVGTIATLETAPAAEEEETPPGKELTATEKRKLEIIEEITSLGHTPPEKGSLKKFEDALEEAQRVKKAEAELAEGVGLEPEAEAETETETEYSVENARTMAHAVVKSTPDSKKGHAAFAGVLKLHKVESLSKATPAQLAKIIPELEKYLGKTLAEVLEAAED